MIRQHHIIRYPLDLEDSHVVCSLVGGTVAVAVAGDVAAHLTWLPHLVVACCERGASSCFSFLLILILILFRFRFRFDTIMVDVKRG